ncbi:MAG: DUF3437 domain-containing protein [Acidobacteriota bacterium]
MKERTNYSLAPILLVFVVMTTALPVLSQTTPTPTLSDATAVRVEGFIKNYSTDFRRTGKNTWLVDQKAFNDMAQDVLNGVVIARKTLAAQK